MQVIPKALHQSGMGNHKRKGPKGEKNVGMDYGEIKAYFIGPKVCNNGCSCSEFPKAYWLWKTFNDYLLVGE